MQRICGPFGFKNLFMPFERFLSTSMFFCSSIYIETALNFREECNECTDILSWRLSLCLSRDSVLWHSLTRSLYFIQVLIFIPLIHSAHSCAFHTFCFTPTFSYVYYHAKYFSYLSLMILSDRRQLGISIPAVKGLSWTILYFLTFIVLIQWNFPYNISANLLKFANKASSHVAIV